MKRGLYTFSILALLLILALAPRVYSMVADCDVSAVPCALPLNDVTAGRISADGHFTSNILAPEPYYLCCKNVTVGTGTIPAFKFSNDGHVSVNSTVTTFPNNLLLGLTQNCSLKPNCVLGNDEFCIIKVANSTRYTADNSHVYDCDNIDPSRARLCCKLTEYCGNGLDDDLDGYIDCADPDCYAAPVECTGSPYNSSTCTTLFRNPNFPYNYTSVNDSNCVAATTQLYYCSYPRDGTNYGICCIPGRVATFNIVSGWTCQDSENCGLMSTNPFYPCAYDFDVNRSDWFENRYVNTDWCVSRMPDLYSPDGPILERSSACCFMAKDGDVDYFTDVNNVKIFGTS